MELMDLLGNPNNQLITRITDQEYKHLLTYKKQYEQMYKETPSVTRILRLALMEYLAQNLKQKNLKKK